MRSFVNWGILNTGRIARCFARNLAASKTGRLLAVASRDTESAAKLALDAGADRSYGDYHELLVDRDIDAVYISTPHPFHARYAIDAAKAGKHVLVEKPIAMNEREALAIVEAARSHDVLLMEAFMYRSHPQTARLIELIRKGIIGDVRSIRALFGYNAPFDENSRVFSRALAGGGILDVGCYCISMSRLLAGVALGKDFAEPVQVSATGHIGSTGIDEWAFALLTFPRDIIAQVGTSVRLEQDNDLTVEGSEGRLSLPNPWVYAQEKPEAGKIVLWRGGNSPTEIVVDSNVTSYAHEADAFGSALLSNKRQVPPAMTWEDSLGNIRALDRWRACVGLRYDADFGS